MHGMNVMTAMARVGRAILLSVMRRDLLALWAIDAFGIAVLKQPFQAHCVVRECAVKLEPRECSFAGFRPTRIVAIALAHVYNLSRSEQPSKG